MRAETSGFMLGRAASRIVLFCALSVCPALASEQGWPVSGAETRLILRRSADSAWPAMAGEVMVWPQGISAKRLGVAVYGEDGARVASRIFWAAEGEPVKVLFDTSGQQMRYLLYLTTGGGSATDAWEPEAGLMIETRKLPDGEFETAEQILGLWGKADRVEGRSYVPRIFLGVNPHGPTADFIARFRGYLRIEEAGRYEFATASDDGSVLMIDGQEVVSWPGVHYARGGVSGKYSGEIDLGPGRHRIDYYWVQKTSYAAAVGAWKPPGAEGVVVIPQGAFEPVARFEVEGVDAAPGDHGESVYLEWWTVYHSMLDELGLFTVEFRVPGAKPEWDCVFRMDDGVTLSGPRVRHTFVRASPREVRLDVTVGGRPLRSLRQICRVQPRWNQGEMWTEFNFLKQREELMGRDHARVPVDDLAALIALAGRLGDRGLIALLGEVCMARSKEFKAGHWEGFLQLGRYYAGPDMRDYAAADAALRAAVRLAGKTEPGSSTARLGLALFLLDVVGNPIEAEATLKGVVWKQLPAADVRKWQMARADVQMALGLGEAARRILAALTDPPDPTKRVAMELARRAKLEAARDYIRRGEHAAAIDVLDDMEAASALERMSLEVGLLRAKVFKGRGEYPRAVSLCRRLLSVAGAQNIEDARAELLYTLIETERAMGRTQQADREFARLLEEHPLSEAAARGKEAWVAPGSEGGAP